jgi:hypothetical protein
MKHQEQEEEEEEEDVIIIPTTTSATKESTTANFLLLDNRFVTHNNGVTGKQRSLCNPCDSYVIQQYKNCWERYFLCGQCRGVISRRSLAFS